MPTYEYVCEACGFEFEKFQSIKADAITLCPNCGKETAQRLIGTGAGLIFKGSGFYITDYRSENYKSGAKKDVPAAAPTSSAPAADAAKPKTDAATTTKSEPAKPVAPAPKSGTP